MKRAEDAKEIIWAKEAQDVGMATSWVWVGFFHTRTRSVY